MSCEDIPGKPLDFIVDCVRNGRIYWTYHVNMRMKDRFISRSMIIESIEYYQIIEYYPDDRFLPSYLVFSRSGDTIFHIVFATDFADNNVRVVTAYRPDPSIWEIDFKKRRNT